MKLFFYADVATSENASKKTAIISIYADLWAYTKQADKTEGQAECNSYQPLSDNTDNDPIYDEVESMIPTTLPPGAKIIPVGEPASAYDEVIINDSKYSTIKAWYTTGHVAEASSIHFMAPLAYYW